MRRLFLSVLLAMPALSGIAGVSTNELCALRMAVSDLAATFPDKYSRGAEFLRRLDAVRDEKELVALRQEALLANPLLDFERLLVVRRG